VGAVVGTWWRRRRAGDGVSLQCHREQTSLDGYYTITGNGQVLLTAAGVAAGSRTRLRDRADSFSYGIEARDAAGNWSAAESISLT